jgi:hypothetical protein
LKHPYALLISTVVLFITSGCVNIVRHSFGGLGPAGDTDHPLILSSGQFYKSAEGAWHFKTTSSEQFPTSTDWPYAFGLYCNASDVELLKFTVCDDRGTILSFAKLSPAVEDYVDQGTVVILAPEESLAVEKKSVLKTGTYRIEVTYRIAGALHQAAWTIVHRQNTNSEAWEIPKS